MSNARSEGTREFEEIIRAHGNRLYRMALHITGGNEAEARDLVQEAFLKTWRQWKVRRPTEFEGWMYRLMRNAFNTGLRRKYRVPTLSLDAPDQPDAQF